MAVIPGTTGNDTLIGAGNDSVLRSETQSGLHFTVDGSGNFFVSGANDGTDQLIGIEQIVTADGTLTVRTTGNGYTSVNTTTASEQFGSAVSALADGGYVVAWQSYQDGSAWGIYAQRFDANGNKVGAETLVNTTTSGDQTEPVITTLADGGYVVAWHSLYQDGSDWGVYLQRFDANGIAVGTETQVNNTTSDSQQSPSITALADGGYVVAWSSVYQEGSDWGVFLQRFDASGAAVGTETQVNTFTDHNQSAPTITALADGGYVVAWHSLHQDGSGWGIYTQRFDASGAAVGTETQVNTYTTYNQSEPTITGLADGGYVVAWTSENQDEFWNGVFAQRFDASGAAVGTETQINTYTTYSQQNPVITALSDGGYVVVWMSIPQDSGGWDWGIYAQRFDASGNAVGAETLVNSYTSYSQHQPSVTGLADGGYVITWSSEYQDGSSNGIFSQRYSANGQPEAVLTLSGGAEDNVIRLDVQTGGWNAAGLEGNAGNDTLVGGSGNDVLDGGTGNDSLDGGAGTDTAVHSEALVNITWGVAADGGVSVSGSTDSPEGTDSLRNVERVITADGSTVTVQSTRIETRVNSTASGEQTESAVTALADGGYVVTWQSQNQDGIGWGIYAQRFDVNGNKTGAETLVNTTTSNDQQAPSITTLADGGYVVAWHSLYQDGSGWGVYAQRFDANGTAVGNETQVNTTTNSEQYGPTITALADGGYVVAWHAYNQDGSDYGVFLQRFDASGAVVGTETQINTYTSYDQQIPSITALADGGYVVAWMSLYQDGSEWGIYTQRFDASGAAVGTETQVNTTTYHYQYAPVITALADGGYVVAWMSLYQDGSDWGVYLQRFDASGTAAGVETQVNTHTYDRQQYPSITALADGGYVVVWMSLYQNDQWDVYTQRFNASGVAVGAETLVNSFTSYSQHQPSVTGLADGGYVITWTSENQDGSGNGIFSQRYTADGQPQTLVSLTGDASDNTLRFDSGNGRNQAVLDGGAGNDSLIGGTSNDTLQGGSGADTLQGGAGSDTYYVDDVGDVVTETDANPATGGLDTVISSLSSYTLGAHVENGTLVSAETASLTGNSLNNRLLAGAGDNTIDGGAGIDTVSYENAGAGVNIDLSLTSAQSTSGSGVDTLLNIENLVGSAFDDSLMGNAEDNRLEGAAGSDTLDGGTGADTLVGGAGDDVYVVNDTGDVVTEQNNGQDTGGIDTVAIVGLSSYTLGSNIENAVIVNNGASNITGNSLNNHIVLDSGSGDNIIDGGAGIDTVSYMNASAGVNINLGLTSAQNTGGSGVDTLLNIENLVGSAFNDTFTGNGDNNILDGGAGTDTVIRSETQAQLSFVVNADGSLNSTGTLGGADTFINVEQISTASGVITVQPGTVFTPVNTTTYDSQTNPTVSGLTGGGHVVTWMSANQDGSGWGIYAQRFDASGAKAGAETLVNTITDNDQVYTSIAPLSNGGYVITWQSSGQDGYDWGIYAQRFDASGAKVGAETLLNTTTDYSQTLPRVTALSSGYAVTWHSYNQDGSGWGSYVQRFDASGDKVGAETLVNTTTDSEQLNPVVTALTNGGFVVTWQSYQDDSGYGIYAQRFDANGAKVGTETLVNTTTDGDQHAPAVTALGNGGYVVTWHSYQDGSGWGIYAQHFDASGIKVGTETQVNTTTSYDQSGPVITTLSSGDYVITWNSMYQDGSGWGIYAQRFDASGDKVGAETLVNTYTGSDQVNTQISALSNGGYTVTWQSYQDGNSWDIYSQSYDANGKPVGLYTLAGGSEDSVLQVQSDSFALELDGNAGNDTLVSGSGNDVLDGGTGNDSLDGGAGTDTAVRSEALADLTWGVAADGGVSVSGSTDGTDSLRNVERVITQGGSTVTVQSTRIDTRVNTTTSGEQTESAVTALADGGYVVTWQSQHQDGSGWGIYAQRFDVNGNKTGAETLVNTTASNDQQSPSITALADGGYVVAWTSQYQDGSDWGVYLQRFDAGGAAVGNETRVNTFTSNSQSTPTITALADGGYVVAWMSWYQDGHDWGIHAQRFDASGAAVGTETQINTYTSYSQQSPSITALADGGYVVAWMSLYQDNGWDGWGIYTQRFDASGAAVGTETLTNTTTNNHQMEPTITALADGGYVVAWMSQHQNDQWDVYTQRFDASGAAMGTETQINTYTTYSQQSPVVTALADGGYVVVWMSIPQDSGGWDWGIYAQRFDASGAAVGIETLVNSFTAYNQHQPSVTGLADGGYVITWTSENQDGSGNGIYSQRYTADGQPQSLVSLTGDAGDNTLRFDSGNGRNQSLLDGGAGNDSLIGGTSNDTLQGGQGSDTLQGGEGNDSLRGGEGADFMQGGAGSDTYHVDNVGDIVHETDANPATGGVDTVETSLESYTLTDHVEIGRIIASQGSPA
ncbi:MAG: hypothetical protein RLZZ352_2393, partial [Pseudomonadota bacterium]